MKPNYNELAKKANDYTKRKGFQDKPLSPETLVMLIITEVAELIEADRKDRRAKKEWFDTSMGIESWKNDTKFFVSEYDICIKGTIEEEMADIMIRLLMMIGYLESEPQILDINHGKYITDSIIDTSFYLTKDLMTVPEIIKSGYNVEWYLLISFIEQWALSLNIDLYYFVDLKMRYNELRPHKHNKKY